jgi:hypothetical protein
MNRKEHLLVILEEEAIEVAKAALDFAHSVSKGLRFGLVKGLPDSARNNLTDLNTEFSQLVGTLEMLKDEGIDVCTMGDRTIMDAKKAKVELFLGYSRARGTLTD